jgi:hypothetical protein
MTGIAPSSALHLAVEGEYISAISLLLTHKASIESVNFRVLMPFEMTK